MWTHAVSLSQQVPSFIQYFVQIKWHQSMSTYSQPFFSSSTSVIYVNENENENGENNEFVNEN